MSSDQYVDKLCDSTGKQVRSEVDEVLWKPMANLFGFGSFINSPYDKLQSKLAQINAQIDATNTESMQEAVKNEIKIEGELLNDMLLMNQQTAGYMNYNNTIINDKVNLNSMYIAGSFFILLIFILFYLSAPMPLDGAGTIV